MTTQPEANPLTQKIIDMVSGGLTPSKMLHDVIDAKVADFRDKFSKIASDVNPAEFINDFLSGLFNLGPNLIVSTAKALSTAAESVESAVIKTNTAVSSLASNDFSFGQIFNAKIGSVKNEIAKGVLGSDWENLIKDSPALNEKMESLGDITKTPEFKDKVTTLMTKLTTTLLESVNNGPVRDTVDKISTKIENSVNTWVDNMVSGAIKTMLLAIPPVKVAVMVTDKIAGISTSIIQKLGESIVIPAADGIANAANAANAIKASGEKLRILLPRNGGSTKGGSLNRKYTSKRSKTIFRKHRPTSITIKKTCKRINGFIKRHGL